MSLAPYVAAWDLYGAGRRRDVVTFGNGTTATYDYDGFRRPIDISHETSSPTEFAGYTYGWDKNDNPLYEERSHQSGKGDVYGYDNANRLVTVLQDVDDPAAEVASPGSETYVDKVQYNMDDVLNFTSLVTTPYGGSASSVSYTTNTMNEYSAVGGTTHVYDDNGNLVDDDTYEYVYNWKNQLIELIDATSQSTIGTYTYDCYGWGRRIGKVVGSDTTRFVYANQQCLEEYDGSDDLLRLFAFGTGLDEVVMMEAPDVADVDNDTNTTELKRFYYHTQLIGSVTQITDDDEVVVEEYDYGPYGEIEMFDISSSSISTSAIGNPFTYTGRRLDDESGLYYFRARHYSSELKRFIQRDPLEYTDGPSPSAYVGGRVTSHVDPNGLLRLKSPDGKKEHDTTGDFPGGSWSGEQVNNATGGESEAPPLGIQRDTKGRRDLWFGQTFTCGTYAGDPSATNYYNHRVVFGVVGLAGHDYKWYQWVKVTATWAPNGTATTGWNGDSASGSPEYQHQGSDPGDKKSNPPQSGTATMTDGPGMTDSAGVSEGATAQAAATNANNTFNFNPNIPSDTPFTLTWRFRTILVDLTADRIVLQFDWSFSIDIDPDPDGNSTTTDGTIHVGPITGIPGVY